MQNQMIDRVISGDMLERLLNAPSIRAHGEALDELRALVEAPAAQPQGEPVAYLDLEKIKPAGMAYATAVRVNHRQEALYIRPDPSEQRAHALLAEVINGEPEAYKNAFYPDRHGPDMAEWVERVRKELGQ